MPYISRQDDISALPLSVRSLNCLRRADIHTIGAMMDYPSNELIKIRNMGVRSIEEIQQFVQALTDGTGEYVLVAARNEVADESTAIQEVEDSSITVFLDEAGAVVQDIAVKDLQLSVRAKNNLTRSGYKFASQLVGLTYQELMNVQNMGKKTVEEVLAYIAKISVKRGACSVADNANASGSDLAAEMCVAYGEEERVWQRGFDHQSTVP